MDRVAGRMPLMYVAFASLAPPTAAQHSIAHTEAVIQALHASNPFYARRAFDGSQLDALSIGTDASSNFRHVAECGHDIQFAWAARLGSSIYSTPVITEAATHEGRAVVSNTFVRFVEAVHGVDGHALHGWPYAFESSSFHNSPLLFDIDADGTDDLLVVSFEAEIAFLKRSGLPLGVRPLRLPPLKVPTLWYEGVHDVHTIPMARRMRDFAAPDVSAEDEGSDPIGTMQSPRPVRW
eukprot:2608202-Pleurochrysis_carterae.AAC.2